MSGVVVGDVFGPARYIQAQRNRVMLGHDQATLSGVLDLRIVGKNPRSGSDHVSFEAENSLKNAIPDCERDSRFVLFLSRRPSS